MPPISFVDNVMVTDLIIFEIPGFAGSTAQRLLSCGKQQMLIMGWESMREGRAPIVAVESELQPNDKSYKKQILGI